MNYKSIKYKKMYGFNKMNLNGSTNPMGMGQMINMNMIPNQNMQNPIGMANPMPNPMLNPMLNPIPIQMNAQNDVITRIKQEYNLCEQDNDLVQIGCNFGLENNNIFTWRITISGPTGTPYEGGLYTIIATFPQDYPNHGPEFKFINKIYHLNVNFSDDPGHICLSSLNDWRIRGQVKDQPFYTVKQALFDIFCLFYNQGVIGAYDQNMAAQYTNNREQFNATARQWTQLYARAK